jgi:hypothetical protein
MFPITTANQHHSIPVTVKSYVHNVRAASNLQQILGQVGAYTTAKLGVFVEQRMVLNLPRLRTRMVNSGGMWQLTTKAHRPGRLGVTNET